ncbi:MAG TPA: flagellar biosynthesis anti-sigma factor FlgM [Parasulfuritortus sp.]
MKIEDPLTGATTSIPNQRTRAKGKTTASPASTSSNGKDSVEITTTSAQLSQMEDTLNQLDTTETGKLEAVRQAVAEGRFQVNEEAVANALVQSSIEHLKRQGRK